MSTPQAGKKGQMEEPHKSNSSLGDSKTESPDAEKSEDRGMTKLGLCRLAVADSLETTKAVRENKSATAGSNISGRTMDRFRKDKETLGPHDVVMGRGLGSYNHDGNKKFRKLVAKHKIQYMTCAKNEKPKVAKELVRYWRSLSPPGRFVARSCPPSTEESVSTVWMDVGDRRAHEKASQCLRERTPDVMPVYNAVKAIQKEHEQRALVSHALPSDLHHMQPRDLRNSNFSFEDSSKASIYGANSSSLYTFMLQQKDQSNNNPLASRESAGSGSCTQSTWNSPSLDYLLDVQQKEFQAATSLQLLQQQQGVVAGHHHAPMSAAVMLNQLKQDELAVTFLRQKQQSVLQQSALQKQKTTATLDSSHPIGPAPVGNSNGLAGLLLPSDTSVQRWLLESRANTAGSATGGFLNAMF